MGPGNDSSQLYGERILRALGRGDAGGSPVSSPFSFGTPQITDSYIMLGGGGGGGAWLQPY